MKVKSDFITNSSSSNYLVFIPDNFDIEKFIHLITDEDVKDYIDINAGDDETEYKEKYKTKEGILDDIRKEIKYLIDGGEIFQSYVIYFLMTSLLKELDLVISDYEGNQMTDGGSMINLNTQLRRENISKIISGGWGLKHGGWGHESKG